MSRDDQERDESVSMDWNDSLDAQIRELFGRKTGRPTKEEEEFRGNARIIQQAIYAQRLGLFDDFNAGSGQASQISQENIKTGSEGVHQRSAGIVVAYLEQHFGKVPASLLPLVSSVIAPYAGIIALLGACWVAEIYVDEFPPILHTGVQILLSVLSLLQALTGLTVDLFSVPLVIPKIIGEGLQATIEGMKKVGEKVKDVIEAPPGEPTEDEVLQQKIWDHESDPTGVNRGLTIEELQAEIRAIEGQDYELLKGIPTKADLEQAKKDAEALRRRKEMKQFKDELKRQAQEKKDKEEAKSKSREIRGRGGLPKPISKPKPPEKKRTETRGRGGLPKPKPKPKPRPKGGKGR